MNGPEDVKEHWENRYSERTQIWSGRANHWLEKVAGPLTPGRALDLGCGEGADSVWLAEKGWQVVGVDISETALERAAAAAEQRGVGGRARFVQCDLSADFPDGEFDLVSAHFLQSFVHLDRPRIFRSAAAAVAAGGTLLIVDHAAAPPSADHLHDFVFPTVDDVLGALDIDAHWEQVHAATVERDGVGHDGEPAVLLDNLVVLRRR
ncbi:class I SAM-dependent methyltransferase [Mycobacterium sp. SMC-4]|uniref:class I SAM-dependent methyltransferase n=1 Tax=Mycobacterium sp. SMC-4 TaxID=2857059 RepID=UPI003D021EEA